MSTPRSALFCTQCDCAAAKLRIFSRFCKKLSTFYFPGNITRMIGQKNLLALHAMLSASLSVSKCSPVLCPPLFYTRLTEWRNLPVSHTMLEASLPESTCSHTPAESDTRMVGRQNLPVPHAKPAVNFPESTCSHRLCPPHRPSSHTIPS